MRIACRIGYMLMALLLLGVSVAGAEQAQIASTRGDVTAGVTWTLNALGELFISADTIPDQWIIGVVQLKTNDDEYLKKVKSLRFDDNVRTIGSGAFADFPALEIIDLGTGVTSIGSNAFSRCEALKQVALNVQQVGDYAFSGCTKLENVMFGERVETVGSELFSGCTALVNVTFEGQSVPDGALNNCKSLCTAVIGENVRTIGKRAFSDCTSLHTVFYSGTGLTAIEDNAFEGCTALDQCPVPDGLLRIGSYAFSGCTGLKELTLPASLAKIGENAFGGCTGLTELPFSDAGDLRIGAGAFNGCTGLRNLAFPNAVFSIGSNAFANCTGLQQITLNAQEEIHEQAFFGCTNLKTATLKATPAKGALRSCAVLETLIIDGSADLDISDELCMGCDKLSSIEWVADVAKTSMVKVIGTKAFSGCTELKTLSLPEGVIEIGDNAFEDCLERSSITLPKSLKVLGSAVFSGNKRVETLGYRGDEGEWKKVDKAASNSKTGKKSWYDNCNRRVITKYKSKD